MYTTDQRDIKLRNAYLENLWKQLKDGVLKKPFDEFPKDNEPLKPFTTIHRVDDGIHRDVGDKIHQDIGDEMIHRTSEEIHQVDVTHDVGQVNQTIQVGNLVL